MFMFQVIADEIIPKLVQGIKGTLNNPESAATQLNLISAANDMIQVIAIPYFLLLTYYTSILYHASHSLIGHN